VNRHQTPAVLAFILIASLSAIFWFDFSTILPEDSPSFVLLSYAPIVMLSTAGVLGLQIYQSRILFLALIFTMLHFLLIQKTLPEFMNISMQARLMALPTTLPWAVMSLFLIKESRLISYISLLRILLFSLPSLVLLFMVENIDRGWAARRLLFIEVGAVPHLTIIGASLSVLILVWLGERFGDRTNRRLILAIAAAHLPFFAYCYQALSGKAGVSEALLVSSVFSFVLIFVVYRIYWERVYIDDLTDVPNRRALDETTKFLKSKYTVAMLDIDLFKKFNDRYGHQTGDQVLRRVAQHLAKTKLGKVYRYGGEEFCMVFHKKEFDDIIQELEDLRIGLHEHKFIIRRPEPERKKTTARDRGKDAPTKDRSVHLSISIGVAAHNEGYRNFHEVIAAADRCLYKAKNKGRNCLVT